MVGLEYFQGKLYCIPNSLTLFFSGQGSAKVLVHLSENGPCSDLPKDYLLQFVKRPQPQQIHMFCESPAGGIFYIFGSNT